MSVFEKRKITERHNISIPMYEFDGASVVSIIEMLTEIEKNTPGAVFEDIDGELNFFNIITLRDETDEELRDRIKSYEHAKEKRIERLEKELELLRNEQ